MLSTIQHRILGCAITGLACIVTPTQAASLNDTGIIKCSNATTNGLDCPVAGFPGQDADYSGPTFNFTKLDAQGHNMSASATDHVCVRDSVTGLTWEVKTNNDGLNDKDWTYTWYNSQAAAGNQGTPSGVTTCKTPGRCDTEKFAQDVNAANLCGFNDWRLPTVKELTSIVDRSIGNPGPIINSSYFPNVPVGREFWTSVASVYFTDSAWIVDLASGYDTGNVYTLGTHVMLVRGLSTPADMVDNGNGTVTDRATGLMWAKCSVGQSGADCSTGTATPMNWSLALNAAQQAIIAGYDDWRLPNIKELSSIVSYTNQGPSINADIFPNTPLTVFWSASPAAADPQSSSWIVKFDLDGGAEYYGRAYDNSVRLVRDTIATPGDANNDSYINTLDLIAVINHILGITNAAGNADCSPGNGINSLDLACITNMILHND